MMDAECCLNFVSSYLLCDFSLPSSLQFLKLRPSVSRDPLSLSGAISAMILSCRLRWDCSQEEGRCHGRDVSYRTSSCHVRNMLRKPLVKPTGWDPRPANNHMRTLGRGPSETANSHAWELRKKVSSLTES